MTRFTLYCYATSYKALLIEQSIPLKWSDNFIEELQFWPDIIVLKEYSHVEVASYFPIETTCFMFQRV